MKGRMKKAVLTAPRRFEVIDADIPSPGPDEVLVKVNSMGICGSDLHYYEGNYVSDQAIEYPMSLGHEFSGDIVEIGPNVTEFKAGDRFMAEPSLGCGECEFCRAGRSNLCPATKFCGSPPVEGALSQYYVLNKHQVFAIPDNMTYDDALMAEPLANLLHALSMSRFKKGDTACIIGCGPIGLLLMQVVRWAGASRIFVSEKVPARLEHARRLGADVCIDARSQEADKVVLAETGGRGVDVAFEAAGDPDAIRQCLGAVRRGGLLLIEGIPMESVIQFDLRTARRKELTVQMCRRCPNPPTEAIRLIHEGEIEVHSLITHHFPISKTQEAYEMVYKKADGAVKVIIHPWLNEV